MARFDRVERSPTTNASDMVVPSFHKSDGRTVNCRTLVSTPNSKYELNGSGPANSVPELRFHDDAEPVYRSSRATATLGNSAWLVE